MGGTVGVQDATPESLEGLCGTKPRSCAPIVLPSQGPAPLSVSGFFFGRDLDRAS